MSENDNGPDRTRNPSARSGVGILESDRFFVTVLLLCVFGPLVINPMAGNFTLDIAWPSIFSGDEPHYLVTLNSLVFDGDLDVSNNYRSAHKGSNQAGIHYRALPLPPHSIYYFNGRIYGWIHFFETDPERWIRDESGGLTAPLRAALPDTTLPPGAVTERTPQYTQHSPGLPILLGTFLKPFRSERYTEPAAILFSALAIFLTGLFLKDLCCLFSTKKWAVHSSVLLIMLGSPLWHYSRTLYTEAYLALFATAFFALTLKKEEISPLRKWLIPGLIIGVGIAMKPNFVLFAAPMILWCLARKQFKGAVYLSLGPGLGLVSMFLLNASHFGSPLHWAQKFICGNPVTGAWGLFTAGNRGLLWLSPLVLIPLALWPRFVRGDTSRTVPLLLGWCVYFFSMSLWHEWRGGYCYGPRLIVPTLPLLYLPLLHWIEGWDRQKLPARLGFILFAGISVLLNGFATVFYRSVWSINPWFYLIQR